IITPSGISALVIVVIIIGHDICRIVYLITGIGIDIRKYIVITGYLLELLGLSCEVSFVIRRRRRLCSPVVLRPFAIAVISGISVNAIGVVIRSLLIRTAGNEQNSGYCTGQ